MVFYCYIIKHKFSILKKKAPLLSPSFCASEVLYSLVWPGSSLYGFIKLISSSFLVALSKNPFPCLVSLSPVVLSKLIQITGRFHFFLMLSMQPSTFFKKGICAESFSCFEYFCLLPASSPLKGSYNLHWAHLDNPG